jgi:shikimate dehydrogenase
MEITGNTRISAIIADPIHHVKTPQGINTRLAEANIDGVLVPLRVSSDGLEAVVAGFRNMKNLQGFIVTVPHKSAIVELCDKVDPDARRIGAVNVVRREPDGLLHGFMLDGEGFVAGLREANIDPRGQSAYLAGAGGAANAIAFALAKAGVKKLTIANRTVTKAEDLITRVREAYPNVEYHAGGPDASGHDLVVNATSLGLSEGDALPLDVTRLNATQTVADIIMQPAETALLAAASERGCRTHPGLPMLKNQLTLMTHILNFVDTD